MSDLHLVPPEGGPAQQVLGESRYATLLSRGWTVPPAPAPSGKRKPSRTARILPVDPPAEPDLQTSE